MKIIWDISNTCNLNCKYCGAECFKNNEYLSEMEYMKIIYNFSGIIDEVDLMGGEPLVTKNIRFILKQLYAENIKINIITNGQEVKVLKESIVGDGIKINKLMVSLDGFQEENDANRGTGSYEKAITFLKELIEIRDNTNLLNTVGVSTVLTKDNHESILQFLEYMLNEIKVDNVLVTPVRLIGKAKKCKNIKLEPQKELATMIEISKYIFKNKLENNVYLDMETPLLAEFLVKESGTKYQLLPKRCEASENTFYVDSVGNMYPCRNEKCKIDLKKDSLIDKYDTFLEFVKKKNKLKEKKCACIYKKDCNVCQLASDIELEENEICKLIDKVYMVDYNEQFVLEKPYIMYQEDGRYELVSLSANIKEEYTFEGGEILRCISEKAMSVREIHEYVNIDIESIYRFLIQCYSKSIVKRVTYK